MNAGAEFGHRLGAFFAVTMLRQFDISQLIDFAPKEFFIERVSFETANATDDLLLVGAGARVFVQAKRSLSLSAADDSEFRSVINQFMNQWIVTPGDASILLLALGPRGSQRISQDLRKVLAGLRIGDHGEDPLSKSEQETLDTFKLVVSAVYKDVVGADLSLADFDTFVDRIRIVTFDIENGGCDERMAIVLCSTISGLTIAPQLLWAEILRIAASSSSARHSIGKEALSTLVDKWIASAPVAETETFFELLVESDIPCGREVIAFRSNEIGDGNIVAVMDLRRFDPDGRRRVRFVHDTCVLRNGITGKLIARAGTMQGLSMLLRERLSEADEVVIFEGRESDIDPNLEPAARAHRDSLLRSLNRSNLLRCVQCGEPVSLPEAPLVEVDEEGIRPAFGIIHTGCARPSHRRTGAAKSPFFAEHSRLLDFDLEQWSRALHRGQGIFIANSISRKVVLAWSPPRTPASKLPYCIRLEFEGDIVQYATKRMRVERLSYEDAEKFVEMARHFMAGPDPMVLAIDSLMYGSRSALARSLPLEKLVLLRDAAPVKVSVPVLEAYSTFDNYYAPLMIVLVGQEQRPLEIAGQVVFLTDPLQFDRYYENWLRGGIALQQYRVDILSNDNDLDELMRSVVERGAAGIVNPLIDLDGELIEGVPLLPLAA